MKKGQIQIIFTWIFILVLAGIILVYGVKFIQKTQKLGEDVIIKDFFNKLDDKFQLYYSLDEDSTSVEEFKLTNKVKYVCFSENKPFGNIENEIRDYEDYMNNLKIYDNIFLIPPIGKENRANIDNLDLDKNPKCILVSGGILRIRLTTTVGGVSVS